MSPQSVSLKASILCKKELTLAMVYFGSCIYQIPQNLFLPEFILLHWRNLIPCKRSRGFLKNYNIVDGISNAIILLTVQIEYSIVSKKVFNIFHFQSLLVPYLFWIFELYVWLEVLQVILKLIILGSETVISFILKGNRKIVSTLLFA